MPSDGLGHHPDRGDSQSRDGPSLSGRQGEAERLPQWGKGQSRALQEDAGSDGAGGA